MELRSGSPADEPAAATPAAATPAASANPAAPPAPTPTEPGPARWRVSPGLVVAKIAGTVALAAVAVVAALAGNDRLQVAVAGAAAVGLAAFALRDLIAPVRVAADDEGVTVIAGFARRVRLPWSHIERVRVDARSRHGIRAEYLEIDAGEALYLYSANDLGAPVADVADRLTAFSGKVS